MSTSPVEQLKNHQTSQPSSPSKEQAAYVFNTLYQSRQYFSPFRMSTEEQLIDEIQSLGDQIIYFQEESVICQQKEQLNQMIRGYHGSLERKPINSDTIIIETNKKAKPKKSSPDLVKNHLKTSVGKRQIITTKFLRERTKERLQKSKQQQLKAAKIKQFLNIKPKTTKQKPITQNAQSSKFLEKVEYDYKKFIDKNIPKIVKELKYEKEILQPSNRQKFHVSKKSTETKDILNQTFRSKQKSIYSEQASLISSRQKLNQTFSTLYTNSKTMLQKKQQKIEHYREQMYKKEMQEATFEPKTFTLKYKSKNSYVNQSPSLNNFYLRQKIIKETNNKRKIEKIAEAMEQCSFKPRLNVNSRNVDSVVKEIWRSTSKSKEKTENEKLGEKLQKVTKFLKKDMQNRSRSKLEKQKLNQNKAQISIHSRNELNFLLE